MGVKTKDRVEQLKEKIPGVETEREKNLKAVPVVLVSIAAIAAAAVAIWQFIDKSDDPKKDAKKTADKAADKANPNT